MKRAMDDGSSYRISTMAEFFDIVIVVERDRKTKYDIGAFATYATGVGSDNAGKIHAWGGGMDFTYWFPWKYAGVRFQGAGVSLRGGGGSRTVTIVDGFTAPVTVTGGGGSVAAGILTGDFLLRLPLDDFWPNFHLAPYAFAGFGGIILGNSGGKGARSVRPLL
jgi:hypothetical protein